MDEKTRLELLKKEVMAYGSSIYDDLLEAKLKQAESEIKRENITLNLSEYDDSMLVINYAKWLWELRETPNAPMPRMVRYALNQRIFSRKKVTE